MTISNIFSKATEPVVTKFHVEPPGAEETKICLNRPGRITDLATMHIFGKTFKNLELQNKSTDGFEFRIYHRILEYYQSRLFK